MNLSRIDALVLAQEGLTRVTRACIEQMQLQKLNALLAREKQRGGFYRDLPDHLESLASLSALPFTLDDVKVELASLDTNMEKRVFMI